MTGDRGPRSPLQATRAIAVGVAGFAIGWGVNLALSAIRGGSSVPAGSATVGSGNLVAGDAFFLVLSAVVGILAGVLLTQGPKQGLRNLQRMPALTLTATRARPIAALSAFFGSVGLTMLLIVGVSPLVGGTIAVGLLLVLLAIAFVRRAPGSPRRGRGLGPSLTAGLSGVCILGGILGAVLGGVVAARGTKAVVAGVLLGLALIAAVASRRRAMGAASVVAALFLLLLAATSAFAQASTPLSVSQFHLSITGTPTVECEQQAKNGNYYGCGEGAPTSTPATVTVASGPGGEALVTIQSTGSRYSGSLNNFLFHYTTFTVQTDGPSQWVLSAPAGGDGFNTWPAFAMTGSATQLTGMFVASDSSVGLFSSRVGITLPGSGFALVAAAPTPTSAPSATASPAAVGGAPQPVRGGAAGTAPAALVSLLPGIAAAAGALAGLGIGSAAGTATDGVTAAPRRAAFVSTLDSLPPGAVLGITAGEGGISLLRADTSEWVSVTSPTPLFPGDHVRTDDTSLCRLEGLGLQETMLDTFTEVQINSDGTTTPVGTAVNETLGLEARPVWAPMTSPDRPFRPQTATTPPLLSVQRDAAIEEVSAGASATAQAAAQTSGPPVTPSSSDASGSAAAGSPSTPATSTGGGEGSGQQQPEGDPLDSLPPPT